MTRKYFSLSVGLALTFAWTASLGSQEASANAFPALTTDSTAWQRVLARVVASISPQLVDAAADPTVQPWQLKLPDDPQRQLLLAQLRTLLRARQVMPADTLVSSLEFGPLVIANDTARVEVRFNETKKCHGSASTTGYGWTTMVLVPRDPTKKFWGAAFASTMTGGDRIACPD